MLPDRPLGKAASGRSGTGGLGCSPPPSVRQDSRAVGDRHRSADRGEGSAAFAAWPIPHKGGGVCPWQLRVPAMRPDRLRPPHLIAKGMRLLSPKMAETALPCPGALIHRLRAGNFCRCGCVRAGSVEEVSCGIPWRAELSISRGRTFRGRAKLFPPRKQRIHHRL